MASPYLGELVLGSWNVVPKGYAPCNGQLLAINSNQALFALLGTIYGGNGVQTFGLPNLQGRTPIGYGGGVTLGAVGGQDFHPLVPGEVPAHSHQLPGSGATPSSINPTGTLFATSTGTPKLYTAPSNVVAMNGGSISFAGGGQPHENRTPFLVMNWCIASAGIFPSPN